MTNRKNTKRTLVTNVIALILCISMFVGSTFAWFTDSASTNVNSIVAGKLDVALLDKEGNEVTEELKFVDEDGNVKENVLWEPGATYNLSELKIANKGSLALKFKVLFNVKTITKNFAEVLEVRVGGKAVGTLAELMADTDGVAHGVILPENTVAPENKYISVGETDLYDVSLHMLETAGNEYQGAKIEGISLIVLATQYTHEEDSFDNQYDARAEFSEIATTQEELTEVIKNATGPTEVVLPSGEFKLPETSLANKDITFAGTKDTVINMVNVNTGQSTSGADITFDGVTVKFDDSSNYKGFQHTEKVVYKNATIVGQQTMYAPEVEFINCTFIVDKSGYNVWTYGAQKVTFTDCEFKTGGRAVLIYNEMTDKNFVADITFNNCKFYDDGTYTDDKAAVETGANVVNTETSNKYNITFNNCTTSGFEKNNSTSPLWGNKNSMDKDHLNVVIDGVDVY